MYTNTCKYCVDGKKFVDLIVFHQSFTPIKLF